MIRGMQIEDLDEIMILEKTCFSAPWTREAFEKELTTNTLAHYLVIVEEGKVAGYGGVWYIMDEGHITNIAVAPDFRRRGLGMKLVNEMINQAGQHQIAHMTLEVRVSNTSAIGLYERLGFKTAGIRPKYYTDNQEDARIMWLDLKERI